MLDNGSSISLIKYNPNFKDFINRNDTVEFEGVSPGTCEVTIGSLRVNLFNNDKIINHKFHVVNSNINFEGDGLIGRDMLDNNANCNFIDYIFTFKGNNGFYIELPIYSGAKCDTIFVPSCSEVVRKINLNTEDDVIPYCKKLPEGILIGKTIINKSNPFINIINLTNIPFNLNTSNISFEKLNNYKILSIKNINNNNEKINDKKLQYIKNIIKSQDNILPEAIDKLTGLCEKFQDIFYYDQEKLTVNNFYQAEIKLTDNIPVYTRQHRIPFAQKPELDRQIDNLIKDGIVEESNSDYNSPVFLVPKHSIDGKPNFRLVVDFRSLNRKVISDTFPLPRMDDIFDRLGKARYFSVIDLKSGFHQVLLKEEFKHLTSFTTDKGSFQYKRLPYGLKTAPASFTRMMTYAFAKACPSRAFIYLDDIIIHGSSIKSHLENLNVIFSICREKNLKINLEKCQFFRPEVTYLGHICSEKGISVDPSKVEILKQFPIPKNSNEVKSFVAFANFYRKFIKNFATMSIPLNQLTRKHVKFTWNTEHQQAFDKIKDSLTKMPILNYPDFEKPFLLTTDASNLSMGFVLSQEINGEDKPISFGSKAFTPGESNKSTIEKELTAIHFGINYFRPYLFGRKFIIRTDHKPLIYLYSLKKPSSKLTRMRWDLEEYDFELEYIKGKDNVVSDYLSRLDFKDIQNIKIDKNNSLPITRSMTRNLLNNNNKEVNNNNDKIISDNDPNFNNGKILEDDFNLKGIPVVSTTFDKENVYVKINFKNKKTLNGAIAKCYCENKPNNKCTNCKKMLICFFHLLNHLARIQNVNEVKINENNYIFNKVTIPQFKEIGNELTKINIKIFKNKEKITNNEEKMKILNKYHDNKITGGHSGISRTYDKIRQFYHWPLLKKDVRNYIKNCKTCQINNFKEKHREDLTITETPSFPFESIQIDTVGPLETTEDNFKYLLTIQCELSKYLITSPMKDKSAKTCAETLFNKFYLIYGNFKILKSDRGTEFLNELFENLCNLLSVDHKKSTPYHHETIGSVERSHRELNQYLRNYLDSDTLGNWPEYANMFTFYFNTQPNPLTGYSPFELIFGKHPELLTFSENAQPLYNLDDHIKILKFKLQRTSKLVKDFLEKQKQRQQEKFKSHTKPLKLNIGDKVVVENFNKTSKFDKNFIGPYTVSKFLENNNVEIVDDSGKIRTLHKNILYKI